MRADALFTGTIVLFTLICLISDLRARRIPNWITVPALGLGLLAHTVAGGFSGLWLSVGGFATGFGILFVLWLIGGGGGGDVKMASALGAWLGAKMMLQAFLASAVATVVIVVALTLKAAMGRGLPALRRSGERAAKLPAGSREPPSASSRPGRIVPYAVPLALGTWAVLAFAWWRSGGLF